MTHLARFGPSPFNVALFHEWLDTRSPEEHWELIEGVAVMKPAPLVGHQRIASSLATRSSVDGCVENNPRSPPPDSGFMIAISPWAIDEKRKRCSSSGVRRVALTDA